MMGHHARSESPQGVSEQIRSLEESLDTKLFEKRGRSLVLTDAGRIAFEYAEEIFARGQELTEALSGRKGGGPIARFTIGTADVVPKLIVYRLLLPALNLPEPIHLICRDGDPDKLVAQLAIREIDLVISDSPLDPSLRIRAFTHLLGQSGLSFFVHPRLAKGLKTRFPKCLDGLPFLMPARQHRVTAVTGTLDRGSGCSPQGGRRIRGQCSRRGTWRGRSWCFRCADSDGTAGQASIRLARPWPHNRYRRELLRNLAGSPVEASRGCRDCGVRTPISVSAIARKRAADRVFLTSGWCVQACESRKR
jgi:DNA-binding transcriptional LysR family regulator